MSELDCNAELQRSSLRLVVQGDMVFILSFNEHGPWNIVEGQRRMMTKGNKVGEEYYLRRKAFVIKGNNKDKVHQNEKGYHMVYR